MEEADVCDASASNEGEIQSLNDIQQYLATFNKEICEGSATALNSASLLPQTGVVAQAPGSHGMSTQTSSGPAHNETAAPLSATGQKAESSGSGRYQTVTIVPTSEVTQSGELSYVLIVSPPDDNKNSQQQDLSVYDFKEERVVDMECEKDDDARCGESDNSDQPAKPTGNQQSPSTFLRTRMTQPLQQLMCNYCNYTSPKRYLLTRHMKTHSEERPHKCNVCDRGFKTIASLQNHINTHSGIKPHKCKECDASFTTSGELVRHVRYRHTFEKPHKCSQCDYASVELSKLKRHARAHSGERPYKCPHCSYSSPDTFKLKRHLRIHTGEKPYECDICHARFTQSNSLKAHRLIHTGEKPVYQCELCPTTCGRKTDLKMHVKKLHTADKPLSCKKCGKAFPDRYTYKIHLRTHEGEKCFKCELCPYAALSQRHLESHILTHTGEKPYHCDHCEMSFRQKQLLKRHMNIYHSVEYTPPTPKDKRHSCVECGKRFAHRGNLLRHLLLHDPDNPVYQELALKADVEGDLGNEEELEALEEEEEEEEGNVEGESSEDDGNSNQFADRYEIETAACDQESRVYVQHDGIIYSLQMSDYTSSDGTVVNGEPGVGKIRKPVKVEEKQDE